ncbi:AAA family ATPase [Segnochrobactraceae bacterium EtOH-i3]
MDLFGIPLSDVVVIAVLCGAALLAGMFLLHDGRRAALYPELKFLETQVAARSGQLEEIDSSIAQGQETLNDIRARDAERQFLETTIAALEARKAEIEAAFAELAPKRTELATLEHRLTEARAAVAAVEGQARGAADALARTEAETTRLTRERDYLQSETAELETRRETLAASLRAVQAEEARARDSLARAGEAITEAEAKIAELVTAQAELAATSRAAETSRHVAEDGLARAQAEMAGLQGALDSARTERGHLLTETAARAEELQALNRDKAALVAEISAGRESLAALERATSEAQRMADGLAVRQTELGAEIARLGERLDVLGSEMATRAADRAGLETAIADLRRIRAELEDQQRRLAADITPLTERRQLLELEIADAGRRLKALEGDIATAAGRADGGSGAAAGAEETRAILGSLLEAPSIFTVRPLSTRPLDEGAAIERVRTHLAKQGLQFSDRLVRAFHTALKIADMSPLTVLAGISGTGKSELPRRYAEAIGLPFLQLAVQPRWDSPQDLFGFYNYIEGRYKPTELLRAMVHLDSRNWPEQARGFEKHMTLVLLDEMNLARVEYYFSEFLSRLETRRGGGSREAAEIELDFGGRRFKGIPGNKVYPVERLLFVGTMNEDESTQSLSDKVVDRANVLRFPRPKTLKADAAAVAGGDGSAASELLPFPVWQGWHRVPGRDSSIGDWLEKLNTAMEKAGRPFGHRMGKAIASYIVNYPGNRQEALADQLEMRLFPKLRGVDVQDADVREGLDGFASFIDQEVRDPPLREAFESARNGEQFVWRGVDRGS